MKTIREFLKQRSITAAELARILGYSPVHVRFILIGKRPITNDFRWRFAQAFGFDVAAEIFGNAGDKGNGDGV
jgi:plasmid maintenance system antidote protein VapI